MKESVKTRSFENVDSDVGVSELAEGRGVIYAVGIGAALIGIWGLACFVGGMISSGGPLAFIGNWFKAVSGM